MSTDFSNRPGYASPRVHLAPAWQDDGSMRLLLKYVRGLLDSIVRKQPAKGILPPSLAALRVMGMSLTASRAGQKRCSAIRYSLPARHHETTPRSEPLVTDYSVGYLLGYLASSLAAGGSDQPRLAVHELDYLGLELVVFHQPQWVTQKAEARLHAIGNMQPADADNTDEFSQGHGVVVDHPHGSALLLASTELDPVEDASRFLDRASSAAGLGPDAWRRDDQTQLLTFSTQCCISQPSLRELTELNFTGSRVQQLFKLIEAAANGQTVHSDDEILSQISPQLVAMKIVSSSGQTASAAGRARTLAALAKHAGLGLRAAMKDAGGVNVSVSSLTLCSRPLLLEPGDLHAQSLIAHARVLHLQYAHQSELITASELNSAHLTAWRAGDLQMTAMAAKTFEQRRRVPPGR